MELPLGQFLKKCEINELGDAFQIQLSIGFPLSAKNKELIIQDIIKELVSELSLTKPVEITIDSEIHTHQVQTNQASHQRIKNIILVASGKGGVGKSTVTANLALALKLQGAKIGILDADIYGPSQPQIFAQYDSPEMIHEKKFKPLKAHGIEMISIGNLVNIDSAMIWRGPMVSQALMQMLRDTQWSDLDYLFIDLPPGTGDIQLTIAKQVPVSASIVVTTPQDLSLLDARRAIEMFRKVKISVLGLVENMSTFICPSCGEVSDIFGSHGAKRLSGNVEIPVLGQIPLELQIRKDTDAGCPTVEKNPDSQTALSYINIALALSAHLSLRSKNYNRNIPQTKVEFSKE